VLIENILASFEMDEILFALRRHSAGLNAGRWDYIFSFIKKFSHNPDFVLHERPKLGLDQPFLASYYKLLVNTCHRRGAHATGGMAPHVPVNIADVNQDANIPSGALLEVAKPHGVQVSLNGVRNAVRVVIVYIYNWLKGTGAVVLDNIVEDLATCEISRSLLWQWTHFSIKTEEGQPITHALIQQYLTEIISQKKIEYGPLFDEAGFRYAYHITLAVISSEDFLDFLPTLLYPFIVTNTIRASL